MSLSLLTIVSIEAVHIDTIDTLCMQHINSLCTTYHDIYTRGTQRIVGEREREQLNISHAFCVYFRIT